MWVKVLLVILMWVIALGAFMTYCVLQWIRNWPSVTPKGSFTLLWAGIFVVFISAVVNVVIFWWL
jgi:hypothetical protein